MKRLLLCLFMIISVDCFADAMTGKVKADGGLILRSNSSRTSTKVLNIPDGTELMFDKQTHYETIDGKSGMWMHTSYNGYKGWVFSAFIDFKTVKQSYTRKGKFKCAYRSFGDAPDMIAVNINGKNMYFRISDSYKGIPFEELDPVEDPEQKSKSRFLGKYMDIKWIQYTDWDESGGCYNNFYFIESMEPEE